MTELEVFEAVRDLVAAGEYRDDIPGLPGAGLDGPGVFRADRDGRFTRRMYTRGSPEYLEARARGLVDRLSPLTPAPPEAVAEAEAAVGRSLPSLLHRLYLEVGNGGFGPAYGLLGVRGGHHDDRGHTALDQLLKWRTWRPAFPSGLLPICHWGCAIYSLVDCSTNEGRMWGWDPNPAPSDLDLALFPESTTLRMWFERWLEGRLWQPTLVQDETTGEWRGATDEEQRRWDEEMREV
jgi:hypothetical protein